MSDRYDTSENIEGQFQHGSNNKVLLNKLGIIDVKEMDDVELDLLDQLYDDVLDRVALDQVLTVADISEWHRKWLGNVYEWAGRERSVNMGKDDFQFAVAGQIPRLLKVLDKDFLSVYTPCDQMSDEQLIEAIAIIHTEFILVHPFREGNGRLSRLLASVMALQANKPELDFSVLDEKRETYFATIQAGMDCNYEPLKALVTQVLRDSEQGVCE
tara:strand:- start:3410 stop:4051 length:642 start_codon:yes stop_codon:yes gene_type:complete